METVKNAPVLGIDLGASKIVVAYCDANKNNKCEVILDQEETRSTSCCLAFTQNERLFSKAAEYQANTNPENTIFGRDIKRIIGRNYDDATKTLKTFLNLKQSCDNGGVIVSVNYKNKDLEVLPEHVIAMLLSKLKENAEKRIGKTLSHIVVSVPSVFNTFQRYALKNAISAVGFKEISLINNTTAAAVRYATERDIEESKNILIFDMGATSLEVGIFKVCHKNIEALANNGSLEIGGESFVNELINYFINDFKLKFNDDIRSDKQKFSRLRNACEKVKIILSASSNAMELIPTFHNNDPYELQISREYFERYCDPLFNKIRDIVNQTIKESKLDVGDISEIIMIGGGGRIPKIEKLLKEIINDRQISKTINQDESIAIGAAYYGARCNYDLNVTHISTNHLRIKPLVGDTILALKKWIKLPASRETSLAKEKYSTWNFPYDIFQGNDKLATLHKSQELDNSTVIDFYSEIGQNGLIYINIKSEYDTLINFTLLDHRNANNEQIKKINELIRSLENVEKERKKLLKLSNDIEGYAYSYKRQANSKELNEILSDSDKNQVQKVCDDVLDWLKENKILNKEQLIEVREYLDENCSTILEIGKRKIHRKNDQSQADKHLKLEEFDEAINIYSDLTRDFQKEKDNFEDYIHCMMNKAQAYVKLKKINQAIEDFNTILQNDSFVQATDYLIILKSFYLRADCYFKVENFALCLQDVDFLLKQPKKELLKVHKNFENNIFKIKIKATLATTESLITKNQPSQANNSLDLLLDTLITRGFEDEEKNLKGEIYLKQALCKHIMNRYDEAIQDLEKARNFMDNHVEIMKLRAKCYFHLEKFDEALFDIDSVQCQENDPDLTLMETEIKKRKKKIDFNIDVQRLDNAWKQGDYPNVITISKKIRHDYPPIENNLCKSLIEKGIEANFYLNNYDEGRKDCDILLIENKQNLWALRWRIKHNYCLHNSKKVKEDCEVFMKKIRNDDEINQIYQEIQKKDESYFKKIKNWVTGEDNKKPDQSVATELDKLSDCEDKEDKFIYDPEKFSANQSKDDSKNVKSYAATLKQANSMDGHDTRLMISNKKDSKTSEENYAKPTKASTAKEKKYDEHDKNRPPYRTRSFTNQQYKNSNYQNQ